ncbi:hypothetical protein Goshw_012896 [Gossypium schwendimanii]|uniref:Uncharacterized protein n=1 Tax=Gossypium schwendimanii TaxID=34291 RepID=A0A7J9LMM3_GOSSC|nr:hypothetical protein [Gossypium schwendimanii]
MRLYMFVELCGVFAAGRVITTYCKCRKEHPMSRSKERIESWH